MIVAGSTSPLLLSSAGGYNLTKSLRFRASASAYLNRSVWSSANRTTWTASIWIKRGVLGSLQTIMGSYDGVSSYASKLYFTSGDVLAFDFGGSAANTISTSAVFRDPSAWYHIVLLIDTTQATAANRIGIYVNGVQQTTTGTPVAQNTNTLFWVTSNNAYFGIRSADYLDGYLAEINVVNGQALTPSSFGETSTSTGVWIPKEYTGTYGTNGFYLPFTDVATTSGSNAGLGKDYSGNGNYWTTNNISVTSGTTYDSMSDVPTLTSATAANYAVLNPLDTGGTAPSSANLELIAGAAERGVRSTFAIPTTGLYYAEAVVGTNQSGATDIAFGFVARTTNLSANPSGISNGWLCYATSTTNITRNGTSTLAGAGTALVSGDVLQLAIDLANNKGWIGKNNTWFNGTTGTDGNPSTGANPTFTFSSPPELFVLAHCYSSTINVNFGQRPFAYTPPTGFVALNTFNLPTPTIGATASSQANKYMDVTIWSGDNTTPRSISNSGSFQPDFVWLKSRSNAYQHNLYDAVRGAGSAYSLSSDQTAAEGGNSNVYGYLSAFNSTGFQVTQGTAGGGGAPNGNAYTNQSGSTYVGWQWKANGSGSTNTAGSITSTVSANTTAGFSIVTYTGNGSASSQTVGHGLNVGLSMLIVKSRATGSNDNGWGVSHTSIASSNFMYLNDTGAATNYGPGQGQPYIGSGSTFSILAGSSGTNNFNGSGATYVAYCFSAVAGYSAFGSYIGIIS